MPTIETYIDSIMSDARDYIADQDRFRSILVRQPEQVLGDLMIRYGAGSQDEYSAITRIVEAAGESPHLLRAYLHCADEFIKIEEETDEDSDKKVLYANAASHLVRLFNARGLGSKEDVPSMDEFYLLTALRLAEAVEGERPDMNHVKVLYSNMRFLTPLWTNAVLVMARQSDAPDALAHAVEVIRKLSDRFDVFDTDSVMEVIVERNYDLDVLYAMVNPPSQALSDGTL